MTEKALAVKPEDWRDCMSIYAFDLSANMEAWNTDFHPQIKQG